MSRAPTTIATTSARETHALGKSLARHLRGGEIIALVGDLGAGKTVLVKGIAQGLGITRRITSPTFLLLRVYPVRQHPTIRRFVHVDAYRVRHAAELLNIGLDDYLGKPDTITVIEWADRVKKILPHQPITITLGLKKRQNTRRITIHQP